MQAFVPKNRRIIDLNNVPLVNGTAFVKWRLPSSSSAEHHGHTDKAVIIDHRAYWNYEKTLQVRLTIDRNQSLHDCEIHFEIIQEFETGAGGDTKNFLGRIRLNLAEYVDKSDEDEGIVRRYLMQDSKVNSTLKIGVAMRQVEGDRNFTTPPLKSAMVFGGIAGVISSEQTDPDDLGPLPAINTQSREAADMQDMYRRTLAASWNCRGDDVPADKLVEDLFSGSISWCSEVNNAQSNVTTERGLHPSASAVTKTTAVNRLSPSFERRPKSSSNQFRNEGKSSEFSPRIGHSRKSGSIDQQLYSTAKGNAWKNRNSEHELSEFDVREDLKSWDIGMLSRSSKNVAGLLGCPIPPSCRKCSSPSALWLRDVFVRFQHTDDGESKNDTTQEDPRNPRYRRRRRPTEPKKKFSKVPISITSLGNPAEVVVVPYPKRRSYADTQGSEENTSEGDKDALPLFLRDVEDFDEMPDNIVINERIESFRASYQPRDRLALSDWENLRREIQSSFNLQQLSDYIEQFKKNERVAGEGRMPDGEANTAQWKPGTSAFFETGPFSTVGDAKRVAASPEELRGKYLVTERILRDCWQLGIVGEVGQLDIRLPFHSLSLLLYSEHFSLEELATLHGSKIDVTHSLGLIRITGKQHPCESIREIIYDATNRIREEELELHSPGTKSKGKNRVFTADFLSWVSRTYGVSFDQVTNTPNKMFYLAENKPIADSARRTLNLAVHDATQPPVPFGTYMPASEPIDIYDFDPGLNVSWFDRQKQWFRWAIPSAQTTVSSFYETPFFTKHETRLSDELLKLLRISRTRISNAEAHESITAAVGRCLFQRQPFEDKTISAAQLGKMALPRSFTTDIPRVMPFMHQLSSHILDQEIEPHRVRLVPSVIHANIFPSIELEIAVTHSGFETEYKVQSAKALLSESSVDYLLPECALDLRFTRKLTHDLLGAFDNHGPLEPLQETLRDFFSKAMIYEGDTPLPAFSRISIPNYLLAESGETRDPDGHTTAEYMYLPVRDTRGMRLHQYDYNNHRLNYSFYESGPFSPHHTTDVFLDMDVADKSKESPPEGLDTQVSVQQRFNSFYNTACSLAFNLDKSWREV
ncbi:mitochondrial inner-membrane-bound regulator-domain-containing protein [Aspergillus alliaceus]|uniref:Mitochondrial inner-membrane-bound regulator-domain-containing protein n=1 Tax=Petromyces alliaceus TaxID=209559 RepID=A0A5N7CB16_PETAA|nr:mitochondrial inner-membrane-bound regulator-domain-containing protein [Aspergillus alliaceus]